MAVRNTGKRAVVIAAVTALGASTSVMRPADALPLQLLQCQGTETDTYRPGVTLQPQDIHITTQGRFDSCVDSAGRVTSGSYGEQFTIHAGCNDLLDGFTSPRTFLWNTGDTSVIQATGSSTAVGGQVITTITGPVTQGRFHGQTAVQVITLPQPGLLQCLTSGFTDATGVTTLTIT